MKQLAIVSVVLLGAGCATEGYRANTGQCPPNEACSNETPDGLHFVGAGFSDAWFGPGGIKRTAVGGVQTLTVVIGSSDNSPPLRLPFDAMVEGGGLVVDYVAPPDITLRGVESGTGMLRVLERGTDLLMDKVAVSSHAIERVRLHPLELTFYEALWDEPIDAWAVWAGADRNLVIQLYDGLDTRLVDESLIVRNATPAVASAAQTRWDQVAVRDLAVGQGALEVETGDGAVATVGYRVVNELDEVRWFETLGAVDDGVIELGATETFCFRGLNDGDWVDGVPWEVSSGGGVGVEPDLSVDECVRVTGHELGDGHVVAGAPGAELFVDVTVIQPNSARARARTGAADVVDPIGEATLARPDPGVRAAETALLR